MIDKERVELLINKFMINPNYNSVYKHLANRILYWLPMDTEKLYLKNLKENYQLLEKYNWIDNNFTYKFNSHGFRCEEFTTEPSIMFLGCSHTCGIGLPVETIWPELVSKQLGMRCANLGIGGSSDDTAFRLCHGWIDIIKPKIIMMLEPLDSRIELIDPYGINDIGPWTKDRHTDFFKIWTEDENNSYFKKLKNKLAIENLCISRNIKLISVAYEDLDISIFPHNDLARDLGHRGVKTNKKIAELFLSKI
jgi:hypothetical protein